MFIHRPPHNVKICLKTGRLCLVRIPKQDIGVEAEWFRVQDLGSRNSGYPFERPYKEYCSAFWYKSADTIYGNNHMAMV